MPFIWPWMNAWNGASQNGDGIRWLRLGGAPGAVVVEMVMDVD